LTPQEHSQLYGLIYNVVIRIFNLSAARPAGTIALGLTAWNKCSVAMKIKVMATEVTQQRHDNYMSM
jgi:hypothetical protein